MLRELFMRTFLPKSEETLRKEIAAADHDRELGVMAILVRGSTLLSEEKCVSRDKIDNFFRNRTMP